MTQDILTRNNVTVSGAGARTLLLAHGFGCDQNMWRFVTPDFQDDYRIVLFDYVGSGKSDVSAYSAARYGTLGGYAQDVLDVCAALDLTDVVFVGHSVSAVIGILASLREPGRFSDLILVAPSPRYLNDPPDYVGGFERADIEGLLDLMEKNYLGWASFLAPVVAQNADRPGVSSELERSFCSTDPVIMRRFAEATFLSDNRADLPHVSIPSLIMQCSEDVIAPQSVGTYLEQNLPHSTLRVLEATGHCPHLSHGRTVAAAHACGLASINVTVLGARLNPDGIANPGGEGWVDVALAAPVRVDLLALAAGAPLPLDLSGLPSGTYRQMRLLLAVGDAATPLADSVVGVGGVETALAVPSLAQGGLPLAVHVSVADGQVTASYPGVDVCAAVAASAGTYSLVAVSGGATSVASAY